MTQNLEENLNSDPSGNVSTRSAGIRYGLFCAVVGVAYYVTISVLGINMTEGVWRWLSYIYIFAFIYLAHKYFKDNGDGFMTYGQSVGITSWIGIVSSIITSIFTFIYLKYIDGSMLDMALDAARQKMVDDGKLSEDQIEQAMNMTAKFMTPTSFLIFGLIFGYLGILIAGLIVGAITNKSNPRIG